jgi:hypothetical protein
VTAQQALNCTDTVTFRFYATLSDNSDREDSLKVLVKGLLPTVTSRSADADTFALGESCSLYVVGAGTGTLTYQWLNGGSALTG